MLQLISKTILTAIFATSALSAAENEGFVALDPDALAQYKSIEELYDKGYIQTSQAYVGDIYNFGYWEEVDTTKELTGEDRKKSEQDLYRRLLKEMKVSATDSILEVGCGIGFGAKLIFKESSPEKVIGLDSSKKQVKRALSRNMKTLIDNPNLDYKLGSAEKMPFDNESFTKVFSIEAPKYFTSLEKFIDESHRVLKKDGELHIASFFATKPETVSIVKNAIPEVYADLAHLTTVNEIQVVLEKKGFTNIKIVPIGKHVYPGFDRWVDQKDQKEKWQKNWNTAYQKGFIDYYIITANK